MCERSFPGSWPNAAPLRIFLAVATALAALACSPRVRGDAAIPRPAMYRGSPGFQGSWRGYIGAHFGRLRLEKLREGEFGGNFVGEDPSVQFALVAQRDSIETPGKGGSLRASNRLVFEWQDGGTSDGRGWLLISREGGALTGEFGFGETAIGGGVWNFVRADEGDAKLR